ncbi:Na+/H+ antiporter NhaC family protein [Natranaerobius thermophilus]|uniref:Na+/H+ antiporter NhaC n=1 Tax=Natranaerobius thermophilus (strain ATCC BAA-1301 / DSM 18059 / JW/NM-WN-LF) TaxID=457570 RepID=B2A298_NATTJ|nr:Na+/H+ antiporter NhaC family protein [Natranaerobius thermophilus]ACB86204.1 Na+/H+ antiporter NhaC [Natranaerobius thermophilus JW/NM-WN-LF]
MEFGIFSLLPPVLAIALTLATKNVVLSLFIGIFVGATMLHGFNPLLGVFESFNTYLIPNIASRWNATVLTYGALFGGLVAILQRTGGAEALGTAVSRKVSSVKQTQIATWLFGVVIFFEDYFNALTVGNVMRPVNDKMKVPREKLAYIVDSTAAPICLLVPVSTWVVYVMGLIGTEYERLNLDGTPYLVYLSTIPYNLYAILAFILVLFIIVTKIEFGPMVKAEHRTATTGMLYEEDASPPSSKEITEMQPKEDTEPRMINLILPIVVLVGLIFPLFLWTGNYPENDFITAIGESDGAISIALSAFAAGVVGIVLGISQGIFKISEAVETYVSGMKGMVLTYIILILAWGIGDIATELGTGEYVAGLAETALPIWLIGPVLFIAAGIIAFTTGTSYGTFAITVPIAIPVAVAVNFPLEAAIAAVLGGGIFGDHCSPISDTTVLSSTGSSCDHVDHTKTQMPYALLAAICAAIGFLLVGLNIPIFIIIPLMIVVLYLGGRLATNLWGYSRL